MIDKNMVKQKLLAIQRDLSELAKFKDSTFDEIASNYATHKLVERIIEVVINEAIDINQHLIVKKGKGGLPFDFKESFKLLVDLGVYPKDFAVLIAESVGLRNILTHQYRELDEKLFYGSINNCLEQYSQYCTFILAYLEKQK